MRTMFLWCGACSVTPPSVLMPTAGNQGAPGRVIITGITTETLAENVRIIVQTTAVVEYTSFTLQDPPRLVLTFPGATLGDIPRPIPVAGVVRSIEPLLVPEENAVRCIVYLAYITTHTVEIQGHQLLIILADAGTRTADVALPASTETARTVAPTAP